MSASGPGLGLGLRRNDTKNVEITNVFEELRIIDLDERHEVTNEIGRYEHLDWVDQNIGLGLEVAQDLKSTSIDYFLDMSNSYEILSYVQRIDYSQIRNDKYINEVFRFQISNVASVIEGIQFVDIGYRYNTHVLFDGQIEWVEFTSLEEVI